MLSPTEQRIMDVLADGQFHHLREIHACLMDGLGKSSNVHPHLTFLRRKLRPRGEDIVCLRRNGDTYYQQVRLMASAGDGKR